MPETFTKEEGEFNGSNKNPWADGIGICEWGCYLRLYGDLNPDLDSVYHPKFVESK